MIPEAAVEAAARQLFAQDSGEAIWGEVREAIRIHYREEVRSVLKAAAPHMEEAAYSRGRRMIPDEAVEAATEAFFGARGTLNDHLLAILEAATPRMLAGAWDEAYQSALEDEGMNRATTPNPYRPAP